MVFDNKTLWAGFWMAPACPFHQPREVRPLSTRAGTEVCAICLARDSCRQPQETIMSLGTKQESPWEATIPLI